MPENSTSTASSGLRPRGEGERVVSGFSGSEALGRLRRQLRGEVRADPLTLGLYSTDASIYQVRPHAVVFPRSADDVVATVDWARTEGLPVTPRGAGTSQGGQAVGPGVVVDTSLGFSRILDVDASAGRVRVEPGVVLDRLNRTLDARGLFFPIDVSTSSRATLGGMVGNNSAGARSIRYGMTADHVVAIDAVMADGSTARFGRTTADTRWEAERLKALTALRVREGDELARRVPKVLRHVAGYGLHRVGTDGTAMADLLVGSEGTLAFFTGLELELSRQPTHRVLAVCHFSTLHAALAAVETIVELDPSAVELTDGAMVALGRENPEFARRLESFVAGDPGALLFVEFAGDDKTELLRSLGRLESLPSAQPGPVVRAESAAMQAEVWAVRKAAMNIVMSGRAARKPVSVIEDCAIPLPRLAEWGDRLQAVFARHDVEGTWYAHASVGCLHVRPSLDLKDAGDVGLLRAIAEEALEIVRDLGGSHSGEHGDGRLRSEFIEPMLGPRLTGAFREIKREFDPDGLFNPRIIVDPEPLDTRERFRYGPDYAGLPIVPALDWSSDNGVLTAVERCNNNGACRKLDPGVMCPSFRATREERDSPRGRANTLRLALTGQLDGRGLASDQVYEALDLCVGCKACRRECPTGVDVARLKTEALAQRHAERGVPLRTRAFAHLPRAAPRLARFGRLLNGGAASAPVRRALERLGVDARRPLPRWAANPFREAELGTRRAGMALFADTFNRWFEPANLRAASRVLRAVGVDVGAVPSEGRPLCCGRTYLSAGMVGHARAELQRTASTLVPFIEAGGTVVGLEPSCMLTFRDEAASLLDRKTADVLAKGTRLLSEVLEGRDFRSALAQRADSVPRTVHVHGHCHQKAFGVNEAASSSLAAIPAFDVHPIVAGCCGMAGSFGYEAEHSDISRVMAELGLASAVRAAAPDDVVVADGFSCRHQIADVTEARPIHSAVLLAEALTEKGRVE